MLSHEAEGSGYLERVTPEQWPCVLPQTFPAGAPGYGKDQAFLLQPCADQLGELTPPQQIPTVLAMGSPAQDLEGWDQQRWECCLSFCNAFVG